jgi:predicted Zn-dependent peptidase
MEEFKEHYINQPYGDVWHKMSALAYKVHPYQWPVIGKDLSHIEQVKMEAAKKFFFKYYRPNNAVLVVAGNVKPGEVKQLAEKWFGPIETGEKINRHITQEPPQHEARTLDVKADVPVNAIYVGYKMCARNDPDFYATDLLRDILSTGDSSRLYQTLVKEQRLFSSISAYITETIDAGLFVIEGRLSKDVTMETAASAIDHALQQTTEQKISEEELTKVKNKIEAFMIFGETNILNRAMNLAYFEMLGDAGQVNHETAKYKAVTAEHIQEVAVQLFKKENSNTIRYYAAEAT